MIKLDGIEKMGDVLVSQVRPAEYVESKDATGKTVSVEQVAPPVYYVAPEPSSFPWGWAMAGGGLLFFLLRRPKSNFHRVRR